MTWTESHASALGEVFAALTAAEIDWLILRNHQGLPGANRSKDVDLGLNKKDFHRAEQVISRAVKSEGFERVLVEDFQYVKCLTFFSVGSSVAQSIKIDLLDGFVFRGAQVFHFDQLFSNARHEEGFNIPSVTDDAVMLWLKPLLTGGIVKQGYLPDINRAAKENPVEFQAVLGRVLSPAWAERVWAKIEAGDAEGTVRWKADLRKSAWWKAFICAPFMTVRDTLHHVISEISRRSRRNPATLFSVLGPDGVGKTTFIEAFSALLTALQVKDSDALKVCHFRPHLIPNINKLLTGKSEVISDFNEPHSAAPAGVLSSLLRISYYWLDYVFGYWFKIRPGIIRGDSVVFDRYFYDFIVDPERSRLSLPNWISLCFLVFTPKPDIVFFLDAEADKIYARKQELSPDEISRQLIEFRKLVQKDPVRFITMNASQSPETMAAIAVREVVRRSYSQK